MSKSVGTSILLRLLQKITPVTLEINASPFTEELETALTTEVKKKQALSELILRSHIEKGKGAGRMASSGAVNDGNTAGMVTGEEKPDRNPACTTNLATGLISLPLDVARGEAPLPAGEKQIHTAVKDTTIATTVEPLPTPKLGVLTMPPHSVTPGISTGTIPKDEGGKQSVTPELTVEMGGEKGITGAPTPAFPWGADGARVTASPQELAPFVASVMGRDESVKVSAVVQSRPATVAAFTEDAAREFLPVTAATARVKAFQRQIAAYLVAQGVERKEAEAIASQVKRVNYTLPEGETGEGKGSRHRQVVGKVRQWLPGVGDNAGRGVTEANAKEKQVSSERPGANMGVSTENRSEGNGTHRMAMVGEGVKVVTRMMKDHGEEVANRMATLTEQGAPTTDSTILTGSKASATPVRADEIISRIATYADAFPDRMGRVKILLEPPHLGEMEMEVVMRGDRLRAVLSSENEQVRKALRTHTDDIKQVLADHGLKVDRIEIRAPDEKQLPPWSGEEREGSHREHRQGREQPREQDERAPNFARELKVSI